MTDDIQPLIDQFLDPDQQTRIRQQRGQVLASQLLELSLTVPSNDGDAANRAKQIEVLTANLKSLRPTLTMHIVAYLRERADCIDQMAAYPHEHEYAAGLREAADILDSDTPDPMRHLVALVRSLPMSDRRQGLLKACDIAEGTTPQVNVAIRLERLETAVEALRVEVKGLTMMTAHSATISLVEEP